jgi:hypothetical protein
VDPHDPPVITVPGAQTVNEDVDLYIEEISISDNDAGSANVQVNMSVQNGALTVATSISGGITSGQVTGNATDNVTITAPVSAINATLLDGAGLKYRGDLNFYGAETLTVVADDLGNTGAGGPMTDTETVDIFVIPLFDSGENLAVDEDAGPQTLAGWAPGLSVTGNDNASLFADAPAIDETTGDLTYTSAEDANGVATITLDTSDTFTITVNGVNDAPAITVPGDQSVDEDTDLVLGGISIADVDAGSSDVQVTLGVTTGGLTLATTVSGGVTSSQVSGNGTDTLTLTAPLGAINATLAAATGLVYSSYSDFNRF